MLLSLSYSLMFIVALKVIQEQDVVALHHPLEAQTKLRLKAQGVVEDGNKRIIQQVELLQNSAMHG